MPTLQGIADRGNSKTETKTHVSPLTLHFGKHRPTHSWILDPNTAGTTSINIHINVVTTGSRLSFLRKRDFVE